MQMHIAPIYRVGAIHESPVEFAQNTLDSQFVEVCDSPGRGNVCTADKRVLFSEKIRVRPKSHSEPLGEESQHAQSEFLLIEILRFTQDDI